jgi:co-chaperonin GroES (HSP10)
MADKFVIEPAADYVMVVDQPRDTTIEGIIMPDNVRNLEMLFGVIVFIGPNMRDKRTVVEQRVCYGPYAGKNVVMEGIEFRLLREGQIEGYIVKKTPSPFIPEDSDREVGDAV